jgi:hypothetical protein
MSLPPIRLEVAAEERVGPEPTSGTAALALSEEPVCQLRISIEAPDDPSALDALRHARRSVLREEWTLGRAAGEPSLETAVFSASEILWSVPVSQRSRSMERLAELEARANRAWRELSARRS